MQLIPSSSALRQHVSKSALNISHSASMTDSSVAATMARISVQINGGNTRAILRVTDAGATALIVPSICRMIRRTLRRTSAAK
jgi:2-keto-3-deoxy-L-rhamnonate aldolase RhmA